MAGTGELPITMQGIGTPVSAAGLGEKAGPQASSSSDRSFSWVSDLADKEYEATRRTHDSTNHDCCRDKNMFCFVCGRYEVSKLRNKMTNECRSIHRECYKSVLSSQDDMFAPDSICCSCYNMLRRWNEKKDNKVLKYSSPVIWSIPESQEDCYFCNRVVERFNGRTKSKICYSIVSSVVPANIWESNIKNMDISTSMNEASTSIEAIDTKEIVVSEEEPEDSWEQGDEDEEYIPKGTKNKPVKLFNQDSLNDFIRNMCLPKDVSEYMAAELKSRGMLEQKTKSTFYRNREETFHKYFNKDEEGSLVYCTDVSGLMNEMKQDCYVPEEWRLFIDSSKRSTAQGSTASQWK